jgi:Tfp pilus assembly protein PilE
MFININKNLRRKMMKIKIKTKNLNQPICSKNNNEYVGFMPTRNKGITLVALIITIIILLILAIVTIAAISKSNIIEKTKTSKEEYSIGEEKEKVTLAVQEANLEGQGTINNDNVTNGMNTYFTSNGWDDKTSNSDENNSIMTVQIAASGRTYKINLSTGEIELQTSDDSSEQDIFEKYILGQEKTGRNLYEIYYDEDGESGFKDDPDTNNIDEKTMLNVGYLFEMEIEFKDFWYVKYDKSVYKINVEYGNDDANVINSKSIELIYTQKGNEGKKLSGNYEGWTILYDNGDTVEAISPNAMGTVLYLGYAQETTDTTQQLNEAIKSYNNAIELINDACKNLSLPENKNVRSVGASKEITSSKYTLKKFENLESSFNGVALDEDESWEQDVVRMAYYDVFSSENNHDYWIASREILETENETGENLRFRVRDTFYNCKNLVASIDIFEVNMENGVGKGERIGRYLRPIITVDNISSN